MYMPYECKQSHAADLASAVGNKDIVRISRRAATLLCDEVGNFLPDIRVAFAVSVGPQPTLAVLQVSFGTGDGVRGIPAKVCVWAAELERCIGHRKCAKQTHEKPGMGHVHACIWMCIYTMMHVHGGQGSVLQQRWVHHQGQHLSAEGDGLLAQSVRVSYIGVDDLLSFLRALHTSAGVGVGVRVGVGEKVGGEVRVRSQI